MKDILETRRSFRKVVVTGGCMEGEVYRAIGIRIEQQEGPGKAASKHHVLVHSDRL